MPVAEDTTKPSWADEMEEVTGELPPPSETIENDTKTITEYKLNEDNKKVKIVRVYKTERRIVSKSIALRKTWKKYGAAANDKPGPNPATTITAEEVFMQFITSREEQDKPEDDLAEKLKGMADKTVKCRNCSGDHWTLKCPYKSTGYIPNKVALTGTTTGDDKANPSGGPGVQGGPRSAAADEKPSGKYLPPGRREGANKPGDSMGHPRHRDDTTAIRISNLSESTVEADLEELVAPFGDYSKLFLAKDKNTGLCKGFAYIHYKNRASAANAIAYLNGHGYDHLILGADWSKPQPQHN